MAIDDRHPFTTTLPRGALKRPMPWRQRLRLKALAFRIATLERQLAGEFATLATAPIINELRMLIAERDALLRRFAEPGRDQTT